jgi:hypothetical protein
MKINKYKERPVADKHLIPAEQYTFIERKLCNVAQHTFSIYGLFYDLSAASHSTLWRDLNMIGQLESVWQEDLVA